MQEFILIGIDGGATKISAWEIVPATAEQSFELGQLHATVSYYEIPGFLSDFTAVPIQDQLNQRTKNSIQLTPQEEQQSAVYIEACARVIEQITGADQQKPILVGLGMPGLKTGDGRGIEVLANGPRMIHYADHLEQRLRLKNIQFIQKISHIGSDADYCGIGENYAARGLFRDVNDAYYLGGGTGVADAMKLGGVLIPFDQAKTWIAKSWELKNSDGESMEKFASAGGIQRLYGEICGRSTEELNADQIYPLQIASLARKGDTDAQKTFDRVRLHLQDLLFERITTLYAGWQGLFQFVNENRPSLLLQHPYLGKLLERIIVGQRLGELLDSPAGKIVLADPLYQGLNALISESTVLDRRAKDHYLPIEKRMYTSKLREAPALGAGIDAYLNWKKM